MTLYLRVRRILYVYAYLYDLFMCIDLREAGIRTLSGAQSAARGGGGGQCGVPLHHAQLPRLRVPREGRRARGRQLLQVSDLLREQLHSVSRDPRRHELSPVSGGHPHARR